MNRFDIVIPTFGRPEKLERCINSVVAQEFDTKWLEDNLINTNLFVYFDNNDLISYDIIKTKFRTGVKMNFVLLDKRFRAFGIWNRHLASHDFDGMFYICDDVELAPDCIYMALKEFLQRFPDTDGLVGLNQINITKEKDGFSRNAMGLIGRKFAERFPEKQCFCPDYVSFHADAELGNYARLVGKFHWATNAGLTHFHPNYYKDQKDLTHDIVREARAFDREMWTLRQNRKLLWGVSFERVH